MVARIIFAHRALRRTSSPALLQTVSKRFFSTPSDGGSLVLCDHDNEKLSASTLNTISAAKELPGDVTVLVSGEGCGAVAEEVAKVDGVKKVILSDDSVYGHKIAENVSKLVLELQEKNKYSYIVATSNTYGKDVIPRTAIALDVQPISEVAAIKAPDTFVRPVYAGNAIATVQSTDAVRLLTIRGTSFEAASVGSGNGEVETYASSEAESKVKWIKDELSVSERPELTSAKIVVSGGRALKSSENFDMLYNLADDLKGAVGASRAAVDAGYVPNDMQVGQTGKVVAPDLYIAVGISGAIQHLAGMKDSKTIVAINKDDEAPIFQVADYGLVADLFEAVPKFQELSKS
eukprot:jgi/Bigna1/53893/estExt_Genewise1Plus.C_260019